MTTMASTSLSIPSTVLPPQGPVPAPVPIPAIVQQAIKIRDPLSREHLCQVISSLVPKTSDPTTGWRAQLLPQQRQILVHVILREYFKRPPFLQVIRCRSTEEYRRNYMLVRETVIQEVNEIWKHVGTREEFIFHVCEMPWRVCKEK